MEKFASICDWATNSKSNNKLLFCFSCDLTTHVAQGVKRCLHGEIAIMLYPTRDSGALHNIFFDTICVTDDVGILHTPSCKYLAYALHV